MPHTAGSLHITAAELSVPLGQLVSDRRRPLAVLLHSRGADEGELLPLGKLVPPEWAIARLRGPLPYDQGFAWFSGSDGRPAHPASAPALAVERWLRHTELDAAERPIVLAGYSGGASTALELLKRRPQRYTAAAVIAGAVHAGTPGSPASELITGAGPSGVAVTRVLWSRGDTDPLVPEVAVHRTREWIQSHAVLEERVHPGIGHALTATQIVQAGAFLAALPSPLPLPRPTREP